MGSSIFGLQRTKNPPSSIFGAKTESNIAIGLVVSTSKATVLDVSSEARTDDILCKPKRRTQRAVYNWDEKNSSFLAADQRTDATLPLYFLNVRQVWDKSLQTPVESKTRTNHGRAEATRRTAERRGGAGPLRQGGARLDADGPVRAGNNRPA